jgi:hypothetical protein
MPKLKNKKKSEFIYDDNLDYSNNYEACVAGIEKQIVEVVKENPNITTFAVLQRETKRLRTFVNMTDESIRKAFTEALGRRLGEEIQLTGNTRKIEGKYWEQLTLFKA